MGYSAKTYSNKGSLDSDAQTFITTAAITDSMQIRAINYLVVNLKAASLWTKVFCLYPYVGGAATPHSYNLKAPASFQITWVNSPVHSIYGVQFTAASSQRGATGFIPSVQWTIDNTAMHSYIRTVDGAVATGSELGCFTTAGTSRIDFQPRFTGDVFMERLYGNTNNGTLSTSNTTTHGLFTGNRTAVNLQENYIRGVIQSTTNTTSHTTTLPTSQFQIGAGDTAARFSDKQHALDAFSTGMTAAEITTFSNIIQQYQIFLGRSV